MPKKTQNNNKNNYLDGLLRHFADLRDGTHGGSAVTRQEKESLFASAVLFIDEYATQALKEMNATLLLNTGLVTATGLVPGRDGGVEANWYLSWPEQEQRGLPPVTLNAFFGSGFHHPHLRGATVGNWPLNVFSKSDAAAELSALRAIASADLHNIVFQSDYSIIPATMNS